jgi:hypothetical protein
MMKTVVPSPQRLASYARRRAHVADLVVEVGNDLTTILVVNEDILERNERAHLNEALASLVVLLESIRQPVDHTP